MPIPLPLRSHLSGFVLFTLIVYFRSPFDSLRLQNMVLLIEKPQLLLRASTRPRFNRRPTTMKIKLT